MSSITESFNVRMSKRPAGFIGELSRRLKDEVKGNTPVVTGRLKRGWRSKGSNGSIDIWNNTDYASYVDARGRSAGYASQILRQSVVNRLAKKVEKDLGGPTK